ncbi:hypothetical protein [Luteolibacter sp. LG18]|uniref:hypothetical protein n=1 Tax=Luteolibacter sp. LG18 TaxID=2819286 RepID=UPI002B2D803A|nr:hypothetical protein llg_16990 [Luteolibacter sp. LG18]
MKAIPLLVLPVLAVLVVSCADKKETSSSGTPRPKTMSARMNEKTGFAQDSEGNWKPLVNRRSSFETKGDSPYFKGEYSGTNKQYKTGDYQKKSWWGNKEYSLKEYSGNTDGSRFQKASHFGDKAARDADKIARDAGKSAREGGSHFATKDAREASGKILDHPSDAETDERRRVYASPSVIDWQEERKLNIQETKGILGKQ